MAWPEKNLPTTDASEKQSLGEGVFRLCAGCGVTMPAEELDENSGVCPSCRHHHIISASEWQNLICDDGVLDEKRAAGGMANGAGACFGT